jgi:hypothetical protein
VEAQLQQLEDPPQQAGSGAAGYQQHGASTPGPPSQQQQEQQEQHSMDITPPSGRMQMGGTPQTAGMATPDWLQRPRVGAEGEEGQQASTSGAGAWGLADNVDVRSCRADWLYHR